MAAEIVPGGQAKAIGLEPGDTILSYDGKAGLNLATFLRAVQVPGEGTRELRILRRGEVLTFQVQPGNLGIRLVDRAMQGEKTPSP
jgi:S1-C subfamily serine protease